jgi:hypothetical protein
MVSSVSSVRLRLSRQTRHLLVPNSRRYAVANGGSRLVGRQHCSWFSSNHCVIDA